jgi:multicomponent Na+:H+ antiporter subunit G
VITPLEIVISFLLVVGAAIHLLSSIGLVRFGDVFLRMHASTKASTLGVGFVMVATALYFGEPLLTIKLIALLVIYFFTSPTGVQVLANAAHISEAPMVKETWIDELAAHHSEESESEKVVE